MEDVLDVYHAPYDPRFPLVCMDESNKQLVGEVHAPLAPAPGRGQINDHEYVRNGVAEIFLEVEPLTGRRHVDITERRTRKDWAAFIKGMLDERYPQAIKVRLVMDNRGASRGARIHGHDAETARTLAWIGHRIKCGRALPVNRRTGSRPVVSAITVGIRIIHHRIGAVDQHHRGRVAHRAADQTGPSPQGIPRRRAVYRQYKVARIHDAVGGHAVGACGIGSLETDLIGSVQRHVLNPKHSVPLNQALNHVGGAVGRISVSCTGV